MNWIYKGKPDTTREVIVAFRAPKLLDTDNMQYTVASVNHRRPDEWGLPGAYEVVAWADFPRLHKDAEGNALTHHWLTVEGLQK